MAFIHFGWYSDFQLQFYVLNPFYMLNSSVYVLSSWLSIPKHYKAVIRPDEPITSNCRKANTQLPGSNDKITKKD